MVRPSAGVGYKGRLTNDRAGVSYSWLIVGSGSLPVHRVPDKTRLFNKAQLAPKYPIPSRQPIKYGLEKFFRFFSIPKGEPLQTLLS